jgi:hypothetical protein
MTEVPGDFPLPPPTCGFAFTITAGPFGWQVHWANAAGDAHRSTFKDTYADAVASAWFHAYDLAASEIRELARHRRAQSEDHGATLIGLIMSGEFVGPCPTPWSAYRCDEYRGPGTPHVWQICDANDDCLTYLPASVDGHDFVAWVNAHGDEVQS